MFFRWGEKRNRYGRYLEISLGSVCYQLLEARRAVCRTRQADSDTMGKSGEMGCGRGRALEMWVLGALITQMGYGRRKLNIAAGMRRS